VAGDWKSTGAPPVTEAAGRGLQEGSTARLVPHNATPGSTLSLRLAAAIDAIQEPSEDPSGAAGGGGGAWQVVGPAGDTRSRGRGRSRGFAYRGETRCSWAPACCSGQAEGRRKCRGGAGGPDLPEIGRMGRAMSAHRSVLPEGGGPWKEQVSRWSALVQGRGADIGARGWGKRQGSGPGAGTAQPEPAPGCRPHSLWRPPERKRHLLVLSGPSRVTDVREEPCAPARCPRTCPMG